MSWLIDKEIAIMSVLDHAHIVHLNEVFDEDDTVCFVIELAKGGEVFDRLIEQGNFGENQARSYVSYAGLKSPEHALLFGSLMLG